MAATRPSSETAHWINRRTPRTPVNKGKSQGILQDIAGQRLCGPDDIHDASFPMVCEGTGAVMCVG